MRTGMTDAGVVYLDPDLMRLGRGNLNFLDRELFTCFPCYCGLNVEMSWFQDLKLCK